MAYVMKKKLSNRKNYGGKRALSTIKWIVIHYTANDGDTDEGNGNYFHNNVVKASAHYFVDDDSVTQSVPDDFVAWSVGGKKYPDCVKTGGGKYHGTCNNTNSLSIEICDDRKNGSVYPSVETIENALLLAKAKMKEYKIPKERVIRHFDVTGKKCPSYWVNDEKWEKEFHSKLVNPSNNPTKKLYRVRKSWEDVKSQIGAYSSLANAKNACKTGYSVYDWNGKFVYSKDTVQEAYYPKYNGGSYGIDTVFKEIGVPEKFRGSWSKRKPIAEKNGMKNYSGTATQNIMLIKLAKNGKLKRV